MGHDCDPALPRHLGEYLQVQQLTLDEDGLVEIVALEHPTDSVGVSLIGRDLTSGLGFRRNTDGLPRHSPNQP